MTDIKWGDLVKLPAGGLTELPDVSTPYYAGAKDGLFLHRRLLIGRGLIKQSHWPDNYNAVGNSTGIFDFDAEPIPGVLMAQVASFFRRIYRKYHAEAAVILTMHATTKEWRIFIPTQLVSHGGVNYVFDPTHMGEDQYVVGSIHSHCDFSPFHSGTDTGDTDGNDGLHMTIGYIEKDEPGIVAMASINKTLIHFKQDEFPFLFDYTQLWQHEAPAWWDNYVRPTGSTEKPVGFELYAKFQRSTEVRNEKKTNAVTVFHPKNSTMQVVGKGQHGLTTQTGHTVHGAQISDEQRARQLMADWGIPGFGFEFDENLGAYIPASETRRPWWAGRSAQAMAASGYAWDNDAETYKYVGPEAANRAFESEFGITNESREFNARQAAERGVKWNKDPDTGGVSLTPTALAELRSILTSENDDNEFWEDLLRAAIGHDAVETLFDSQVLTEEDFDWAILNPEQAGTADAWRDLLFKKALGTVTALQALGMDVKLNLKAKPTKTGNITEWLLPEEPKSRRQRRREKREARHHGIR